MFYDLLQVGNRYLLTVRVFQNFKSFLGRFYGTVIGSLCFLQTHAGFLCLLGYGTGIDGLVGTVRTGTGTPCLFVDSESCNFKNSIFS